MINLIDRYCKFDNEQTPASNWHDKQDLLKAVREVLNPVKAAPKYLGNSTVELIDYPNFDEVFKNSSIEEISYMVACQISSGNPKDIEVFVRNYYAEKSTGGFNWTDYSFYAKYRASDYFLKLAEKHFPRT